MQTEGSKLQEAPSFFCQQEFTLRLSVLVVSRVGQRDRYEEEEGMLDGKDACYIMVQAIYQPP